MNFEFLGCPTLKLIWKDWGSRGVNKKLLRILGVLVGPTETCFLSKTQVSLLMLENDCNMAHR